MSKFLISLALSLTSILGFSQTVQVEVEEVGGLYNFENYSNEKGFIGSEVECSFQDSQGYIWACTRSGLNKLDGKKVTRFTENDGLVSDQTKVVIEDSEGLIWVGTQHGVSVYNGLEFQNFTEKEGMSNRQVWCMAEYMNEGILVGTSGGIDLIKNNKVTSFFKFDSTSAHSNVIRLLAYDSKGQLWFGTDRDIFILKDGITTKMAKTSWPAGFAEDKDGNIWIASWNPHLIKINGDSVTTYNVGSHVSAVEIDKYGKLWLGTWNLGLLEFDGISSAKQYGTNSGVSSDIVWNLMFDNENSLWLSTYGGGLDHFVNKNFFKYTTRNGLADNYVSDFTIDQENNVWLANRSAIIKIDSLGTAHVVITDEDPRVKGAFVSIFADSENNIWFTTYASIGSMYQIKNDEIIQHPLIGGFDIMEDSEGDIWFGTDGNGPIVYNKNPVRTKFKDQKFDYRVHKVFEDSKKNVWIGTEHFGWKIYDIDNDSIYSNLFGKDLKNQPCVSIAEDKQNYIWLTIGSRGLFRCSYTNQTLTIHDSIQKSDGLISQNISSLMVDGQDLWINSQLGLSKLRLSDYYAENEKNFVHIQQNAGYIGEGNSGLMKKGDNEIWVTTTKGVLVYNINTHKRTIVEPITIVTDVSLRHQKVNWQNRNCILKKNSNVPEKIELEYSENHVTFKFTGISFSAPEEVKYQFFLEGFDRSWSPVTGNNEVNYSNLAPGTYVFNVKAANKQGVWDSTPEKIVVVVKPAFWQTTWFKFLLFIAALVFIYVLFKIRLKKLQKDKKKLEEKVELRTSELKVAYSEIEEKNIEITDSISYAKRIQHAIIPDTSALKDKLGESFILFKPKDIVAGDFYWLNEADKKVLFAVADCTGHGVPGAMVSVVCHGALNRSVREFELNKPSDILDRTREIVIEIFESRNEEIKDGMDISLCAIDFSAKKLEFSGANNNLYIVRNGELIEFKADKQPIGSYEYAEPFKNIEINYEIGDLVYLFSDGFADQFGGIKGKKMKYKPFKEMLISNAHLSMDEQLELLNKSFETWKGDYEQVDDVCLLGIRL